MSSECLSNDGNGLDETRILSFFCSESAHLLFALITGRDAKPERIAHNELICWPLVLVTPVGVYVLPQKWNGGIRSAWIAQAGKRRSQGKA